MTRRTLLYQIVAVLSVSPLVAGCDQDPFGQNYRRIAGDYYILQWEDGQTYYLEDDSTLRSEPGGGVVGGTILEIGWKDNYIVVKRRSNFCGDADAWMIVNVRESTISGPHHELPAVNEVSDIKILEPKEAWSTLAKWWQLR